MFNSVERIFKNVGFYFLAPLLLERKTRMSGKWTFKYGIAAVLVAIIVIAAVLLTNPLSSLIPGQTSATGPFLVMLTDPPNAPTGTKMLNLTYSNVTLHVIYPDGTSGWLAIPTSGTVELFSLTNMSQTIATTTMPNNSTVDRIQFTIANVEAKINGTWYPVTTLANTLTISIANSRVNQTLSGALVDFNPTLLQIQATNSSEAFVYYYVLVPSATATIVTSLSRAQIKVGKIVELGQNDKEKLVRVVESFSKNLTITSASLSVNGNTTSLNVTLKNEGDISFKIFGLTLHGIFDATPTWQIKNPVVREFFKQSHLVTVPFRVNGTSLIPFFGINDEGMTISSLTLKPGQNATLTFNGIIELQPDATVMKKPAIVVTPLVGDMYTIRLTDEGFQTFNVTATHPS